MKILFLVPPQLDGNLLPERVFGCNYSIYPLPNIFLLYPFAILKDAGHEIEIVDFTIQDKKHVDFRHEMSLRDDDLIVFYTVFLSKNNDLLARDIVRQISAKAKFLFLGTEPTATPESFLSDDSYVIRGESEKVIADFAASLENNNSLKGIPGVSFVENGRIINNCGISLVENLDSLPIPNRSLLPKGDYCNPKLDVQPFTLALTSRGCAFRCYYCVPNSLSFARRIEYKRQNGMMPPVRMHSVERVIEECKMIASDGYKAVSFVDDQFVWGRERTMKICEGIAPLKLSWSCLARADMLLDAEMVKAMADAGCKYIDIGVESFEQNILDAIQKDLKVEDVYKAVENLKAAGIEPEINLLLGSCELENTLTLKRSFKKLLELDVDYVLFSACSPFPYTEFNRIAKERGWMIEKEYRAIDPIKQSFISYPHLSKAKIEKFLRFMYIGFYYRPRYILKRLFRLRSWRDFLNKIHAGLSILIRPKSFN